MAIKSVGKIAGNGAVEVVTDHADAADSSTIDDTNFPPGDAIDCSGWKRVLLFVRFNGGTAPTATIEPLVRCGTGWVKLAKTSALAEGVGAIVEPGGRLMFARVDARTGTPTNFDIWCSGYEPMKPDVATRE